jgi:zinc transporter ZupT
MPGLIAMTSVLIVVGIEMFFAMRGAGHVHGSGFDDYSLEENHYTSSNGSKRSQQEHGHFEFDDPLNDLKLDEFDTSSSSSLLNNRPNRHSSDDSTTRLAQIDSDIMIKPEPKALLQCLLLEAGILFHSVFIGMALSVTPAPAFYVLLIAITFHQTFEGLALGSRISALTFHPSSPHPWLMALAYGTTTPFGQAIGLAIHSMYDPESQTGLLSVGIMNALSSGLLLFAGLVELLAADFLSEESYMQLKGRKRLEACAAVVSGAALMALVGAWA